MGGIWGTIATGLFASSVINSSGPNGLIFGNPKLVLIQTVGVLIVAAFGFAGSYALLKMIGFFTPLRVTPQEEIEGLDMSQHGEEAYA